MGETLRRQIKLKIKKEPTMNFRTCFVTLSYILSKIHSIKSLRKRAMKFKNPLQIKTLLEQIETIGDDGIGQVELG